MTTASWLERLFAWLIDMHISMVFLVLAYLASNEAHDELSPGPAWGVTIAVYSAWWLVGFVNRCVLMGIRGASWGRMCVGTNLVSEMTGRPIGVPRAFVRENCHFIDWGLLGLGWLMPIWDRKKQTVADKVVRTVTLAGPVPNRPVELPTEEAVAAA